MPVKLEGHRTKSSRKYILGYKNNGEILIPSQTLSSLKTVAQALPVFKFEPIDLNDDQDDESSAKAAR